jgi:hypothetical protein
VEPRPGRRMVRSRDVTSEDRHKVLEYGKQIARANKSRISLLRLGESIPNPLCRWLGSWVRCLGDRVAWWAVSMVLAEVKIPVTVIRLLFHARLHFSLGLNLQLPDGGIPQWDLVGPAQANSDPFSPILLPILLEYFGLRSHVGRPYADLVSVRVYKVIWQIWEHCVTLKRL